MQTLASILASRPIIVRIPCGYRLIDNAPRARAPIAPMSHETAFSSSERAWFRKPLAAIALVFALASGAPSAYSAPRVDSAEVARAKSDLASAKAKLKAARVVEKAAHKATARDRKIARLKAQLAKATAEVTSPEVK
jgi:hypothetical protein